MPRRFSAALLAIAVSLGTVACDSAVSEPLDHGAVIDPRLRAETLADEVAPGAVVGVRLINEGSTEYRFNLCGRQVERLEGSAWVELPPDLRLCTAHLDLLQAGETAESQVDVPGGAAPGTYRFVFHFFASPRPPPASLGGAVVVVVVRTNPFALQ